MSNKLVCYHFPCQDGVTSLWVFDQWCKLNNETYEALKADFAFLDLDIEKFRDKEVYFIDYCPKAEKLEKICNVAKQVNVIDHHITARENVKNLEKPNLIKFFDTTSRCGCVMAWHWFFGSKPMPKFLEYIQDYDLYTMKLPNTTDFMAWFESYKNYDSPSKLNYMIDEFNSGNWKYEGVLINNYKSVLIDTLVENAEHGYIQVDNKRVEIIRVNCPLPQLNTFLGMALVNKYNKPVIVWGVRKDGVITNSWRSKEGLADVSKIAEYYKGGGHAFASGSIGEVPFFKNA